MNTLIVAIALVGDLHIADSEVGPASIVVDAAHGREWLRIRHSYDLSYFDIQEQLPTWSIATPNELDPFLDGAGARGDVSESHFLWFNELVGHDLAFTKTCTNVAPSFSWNARERARPNWQYCPESGDTWFAFTTQEALLQSDAKPRFGWLLHRPMTAVPEPSALLLVGVGAVLLLLVSRKTEFGR